MNDYDWLENRKLRSVDRLRLWPNNPRLNPEENHVSLSDYAADLISDTSEKKSFYDLIVSIVTDGFIPADPIVVWKDNKHYYVAEGNRRVLALRLLRHPEKAPRSIRSYIRQKADLINRDEIKKIKVCVAPSFEDTEWYINQRHSQDVIQRPWSRQMKQRWIAGLYDKYEGNLDKIISITKLTQGQLNFTLRILEIRDFSLRTEVLDCLTKFEIEKVKSHRVPMTIFERWFSNPLVKERWGIVFSDEKIEILSNFSSFLKAYTKWIQLVIHRDEPKVEVIINTRTIDKNHESILDVLPTVTFGDDDSHNNVPSNTQSTQDDAGSSSDDVDENSNTTDSDDKSDTKIQNKNPERNKIVIASCKLNTSNYKLKALFNEFKKIPFTYKNCIAASLRVFLDLAVAEYLIAEGDDKILAKEHSSDFRHIPLKKRLEYLKSSRFKAKTPHYIVVEKLLNHSNQYSLDILNNYIHGTDTHHTGKVYLNGFWDFLFPLLSEIMDIKN